MMRGNLSNTTTKEAFGCVWGLPNERVLGSTATEQTRTIS